jgi:hypothetical protein
LLEANSWPSAGAVLTCVQAQIAMLQSAIGVSAAKAAVLKARAEEGEVAQGRLCLAGGPQAGTSSTNSAAAGGGTGSGQQNDEASPSGQVALEDLSKAVRAAYQR